MISEIEEKVNTIKQAISKLEEEGESVLRLH